MNEGFILIHRKIIKEWEWYSNTNDTRLWLHCLLSANWQDSWFEGIKIERGSFVTSLNKLSKEIDMSIQQIRTSLKHLKSTNNITYETNNQFSIITINNYNKYQLEQQANQQTSNKRATNEQQTSNNNINKYNKEIKEKEKDIYKYISKKKENENIEKKYFESLKVNTIFNEFLELRKKLKAVNTDRAINMLINKLNEYDEETQYEMIEQSIINSWKGVFELKNKEKKAEQTLPSWFNKEIEKDEEDEKYERLAEQYTRGVITS